MLDLHILLKQTWHHKLLLMPQFLLWVHRVDSMQVSAFSVSTYPMSSMSPVCKECLSLTVPLCT